MQNPAHDPATDPEVENTRLVGRAWRKGPEELARVIAAHPELAPIADELDRTQAAAPPLSPAQRAGIRAILRR